MDNLSLDPQSPQSQIEDDSNYGSIVKFQSTLSLDST